MKDRTKNATKEVMNILISHIKPFDAERYNAIEKDLNELGLSTIKTRTDEWNSLSELKNPWEY